MSKEDGRMNQHIVPRAHLDRFTNDKGLLWVCRWNKGEPKSFRVKPDNVCKEINYYDKNPYDENSTEHFLKRIEDDGQAAIDRILCCGFNGPIPDELKTYACVLLERNKTIRSSISRTFDAVRCSLCDEEIRDYHAQGIRIISIDFLGDNPTDLYCFHRTVSEPNYLLLSDVPVTIIGFYQAGTYKVSFEFNYSVPTTVEELNSRPDDSELDNAKDAILVMPLTPNNCLFLVNERNKAYEKSVPEPLDSRSVYLINSMMVNHCINEIYSDRESKSYIVSLHIKS